MLTHLRAQGVLVPDAAVLERIGLAARARARQRTFHALTDGVTEAERGALDGLLVTDPAIRRSRFAWLRDAPEAPAPGNMVALLDKLDWVLDEIEANVPRDVEVHLMTDNYATHKAPLVRDWLIRRPHWHVHLTPAI